MSKNEKMIRRLQKFYDDNSLSDAMEILILDVIILLGGEISW